MATINFVPDDYIQQRQSSRANLLYLTLLAALLGGIGITFFVIKMRQSAVHGQLQLLENKMKQAGEQIAQLEELKTKGKTMMKNMLLTAELLEPVPRSVVLASLTNNLPSGVSLLETKMQEKETKTTVAAPAGKPAPASTQFQKNAVGKAANGKSAVAEIQTTLQTSLEIEGIAPSDIEVASYIANLSGSILLESIELIDSKEKEIDGVKFRQFRLRTSLKPNLSLTKDDIQKIRQKREENS